MKNSDSDWITKARLSLINNALKKIEESKDSYELRNIAYCSLLELGFFKKIKEERIMHQTDEILEEYPQFNEAKRRVIKLAKNFLTNHVK